jgi:hypothetical protein
MKMHWWCRVFGHVWSIQLWEMDSSGEPIRLIDRQCRLCGVQLRDLADQRRKELREVTP